MTEATPRQFCHRKNIASDNGNVLSICGISSEWHDNAPHMVPHEFMVAPAVNSHDSLQAVNRQLVAALEAVEWLPIWGGEKVCAVCNADGEHNAHYADCQLAAALKAAREE